MSAPKYKNTLLSRLGSEVVARLMLVPVAFELGHEIEFPGCPINHLFFVEEGMASMTTTFADGAQVEVGMFGYESIIGVSGYRSPVGAARAEFRRGELFQTLALRYVQTQLVQTAQTAGCNARHHMEQRLARWLLITSDRVHSPVFKMSQEFLAGMVGNTRTSVSRAAVTLKDEGLIDYTRGVIRILDLPGLQQRSCECYAVVKEHLDNYAEFEHHKAK